MSIELPPMNRSAAAMVVALRRVADHNRAAAVVNDIAVTTHDALNAADTDLATSIMARALIAHSTLRGAAQFLMSRTGLALPEAYRAVVDLALNMPPEFDSYMASKE